jgi:DNA-binding PadR family transcriptional regulator
MAKEARSLTDLEYVVLGLIGIEPQSGYSIISTLQTGFFSRSASPGAIYPILKRLERSNMIQGTLEMIHETRPRKIYGLTALGEETLDAWIADPSGATSLIETREIVLMKFVFAEKRLTRQQVIEWLQKYERNIDEYELFRRPWFDLIMKQQTSLHQKLIVEAAVMEINAMRTWIQIARRRLEAEG